jgi:N-acetyl-gamma-glutamyl-phosphate reductase
LHFAEANETVSAYKAAAHRHTPEIDQTLSDMAGMQMHVLFVPHLLPLNRGILSTMYAKTNTPADAVSLHAMYEAFYKDEPFVRVMPFGRYSQLRHVQNTNYCNISVHYDDTTDTLIITSAIDNMIKGAAGQAVQSMNIRFGIDETAGLLAVPAAF